MDRPMCQDCLHWEKPQLFEPATVGRCRRYPPTLSKDNHAVWMWARTYPGDWCGEWEANTEAKLAMARFLDDALASEKGGG